jgi:hypothetical protein
MNIGVGANYENYLYFGAGLNFHYADVEQWDTAAFGLDLDNSVLIIINNILLILRNQMVFQLH